MKVENIERIVSITYEILVIGEPVSKEVTEQVAADRKNTQEIQAWDKSWEFRWDTYEEKLLTATDALKEAFQLRKSAFTAAIKL